MNQEHKSKNYKLTLEFEARKKDLEEFIYFINLSSNSWQKHKRIKNYKYNLEEKN